MRQNETKRQKSRKEARDLGIEIGERRDESTSIRLSPATRFALQWIEAITGMGVGDAYAHSIAVVAEKLEHDGHRWSDAYPTYRQCYETTIIPRIAAPNACDRELQHTTIAVHMRPSQGQDPYSRARPDLTRPCAIFHTYDCCINMVDRFIITA